MSERPLKRKPAFEIYCALEELPELRVIADSQEDFERLNLWVQNSDPTNQLFNDALELWKQRWVA